MYLETTHLTQPKLNLKKTTRERPILELDYKFQTLNGHWNNCPVVGL